jgi:hypothetical protein
MRLSALGGDSLTNGSFVTTANQFVDEAQPFDVDRLQLNIDVAIATLFGTVGVTDRLDIGAALPIVALRLEGTRINTYRGEAFTQASASATSVGLADVVLRSKYRILDQGDASLAVAADLRLPTGSEANLLGAGSTSLRISGISSLESGVVSTHLNVGFTTGGLESEVSYGGAITAAPLEHLTMTAEIVGRWIDSPGTLKLASAPHPTLSGVRTSRVVPGSPELHAISVVPGFKWNVGRTWVLLGSAAIPLTRDGLTSRISPFLALDYSER